MKAQILVVEDNPLNRQLVRDLLVHRGHSVSEAKTVDEAREQLRHTQPDLILLDIQIPGGGGELLFAEIRNEKRFSDVPVIAVTALATKVDQRRLVGLGFDAYFSKPIDTRAFGAAVESLLTSRGSDTPSDG